MEMSKRLVEVREELQGRPVSRISRDLESRKPSLIQQNTFGEIKLIPKTSSSGAEGTIFYDSDDNHIYVATE